MSLKDELAKLLTLKHAITIVLSWFLIQFADMLETGQEPEFIMGYMPIFLIFLIIYVVLWMEDLIPRIAQFFLSIKVAKENKELNEINRL